MNAALSVVGWFKILDSNKSESYTTSSIFFKNTKICLQFIVKFVESYDV